MGYFPKINDLVMYVHNNVIGPKQIIVDESVDSDTIEIYFKEVYTHFLHYNITSKTSGFSGVLLLPRRINNQ